VESNPNRQNTATDALSRCDEEGSSIHAISLPTFDLFDAFRREAESLPDIVAKRLKIEAGTTCAKWAIIDIMVVHGGRLFMPATAAAWPHILEHAHGMGHEGVQKTLQRIRTSFTLHDNRLVRDFIRGCPTCKRNKTEHLHPAGLLQLLAMPSVVWSDITMDFVEGFPKVGGKPVILTMVDRFSKYGHFIALGHPYSTASVAKAFFDGIVRLHGIPTSIVSNMWTKLFLLTGTKLCTSSAFRPQTDDQSEVTNKTITVYLRCLAGGKPRSWLRWLPWAEFCYNTSYQTTLKATLFEVVYGRAPPDMLPYQLSAARVATVDHQLRDRDTFLAEIKQRLLQAQALMKQAHDKKNRDLEFVVGEWAWLRLNQRAVAAIRSGNQSNLGPKYFGPYIIQVRIGSLAYKLQLPQQARIHNIFHAAFLKKFEGAPPTTPPPLPQIVHGRVVLQPERVVRARPTATSWEILVQWQDRSATDATWEALDQFKEDFPAFQLKDELFRQAGGKCCGRYLWNEIF
jgi:hypothetical protein